MQYLLVKHGVLPHEYHGLPEGEKVVARALVEDYLDQMEMQ